jgi:hypothetical protein
LTESARFWAPPRQLGGALLVGIAIGLVLPPGFVLAGDRVAVASSTGFALGALVLGFGLTIWATTVWMGDVFETFLRTTVGDTEWSKEGGAVAFSLITALGVGMMLGSVASTVVLRALGV